ncbi:MAG: hypothetical protein U1A27_05705 [Phycisphaerae bacterium]
MLHKLFRRGRAAQAGTVAAVLFIGIGSSARAQTIYVDTSGDVVDFGGAQQVADLPGPDGKISLPEAGLASDNTPGVQTIGFHVPQSDWQFQQFFPGRAVLRPFLGFRVFDTVILDGTTQTAFTGDTYANGGEVVIWQESYLINNVGGRVVGLDHSSVHLSGGSNNVVQGNTDTYVEVFDSTLNLIGGPDPGQGNRGGIIQIDRASDNVVVGNTAPRVRVLGGGTGVPVTNNRIGGPTPGERNYILGFGTVNSEGIPGGYAIQLAYTSGTIIENNQIGTTVDGMQQANLATTAGIWFDAENNNTTVRNNRIAGILAVATPPHGPSYRIGYAVQIGGTGSGITLVGNQIGLDALNQPLLGSTSAIYIAGDNFYTPVQNIVIGGPGPGQGNEIAGHRGAAIVVDPRYSGVRISGNSIHDNGSLGIDLLTPLFGFGVTPNDPVDADTGGNGLQNFPVLTSASGTPSSTSLQGSFNSLANQAFTLEFFASPACSPTGFGQGQTFLGAASVTTDNAGNASFTATLARGAAAGSAITATATHTATGSTSEFSACVTLAGAPNLAGDIDGDGDVDATDQAIFVNVLMGMDTDPLHVARSNLNGDGGIDGRDAQLFVQNAMLF